MSTLLLISCGKRTTEWPKNGVRHGYDCIFDTIKVADSTYVVNVIYQDNSSGSISAVKICVINKK